VRVLGEDRGRAAFLAGAIEGDAAQALGLCGSRGLMKRECRLRWAGAGGEGLQMRRGERALAVGALLGLRVDASRSVRLVQEQRARFRRHLAVMLCAATAAGRQH
jgi:hypothetical protein